MASSFISKDNKTGFWIHDGLFQIVCLFISRTVFLRQPKDWHNDMNTLFENNALGLFPGFMHLDFETVLNTDEKVNFLIGVLHDLADNVFSKGEFISVNELNSFIVNKELQSEWQQPLETKRLLRIIESLRKVLQDEIDSQIDNPWFNKI